MVQKRPAENTPKVEPITTAGFSIDPTERVQVVEVRRSRTTSVTFVLARM